MKTRNEIISAELKNIEKEYGVITPHVVVDCAKKKDSPLHPYFTWDNEKAAQEYRLWQARQIISTIVLVRDGKNTNIKAYQSVVVKTNSQDDGKVERLYMSTERCLNDPTLRNQILERAKTEALEWADKYKALEEFSHIISEIRKAA